MSEKLTNFCSTLDTLIEEIIDLIIVFDTMIMAAEYELEQDYEGTCYDITVSINKDDLTASAEQYKKDDLSEADCPPDPYYPFRGIDELPKSKSWDLTKHEVCTKLAGLLFNPLEDFVSKVNGFLTAGLDLGNTYSKAIEVLGLLQLIYDKGDAILAHFKEENALPEYCVEDFKGYLSFFYDRKIFPQLEKLSKQIKAEARLPETAGTKRELNKGELRKTEPPEQTHQHQQVKPIKKPSKEAVQAYKLYTTISSSQAEVAKIMTKKLKPKKPFQQWQISRWYHEVKNLYKAHGLPVDSDSPKGATVVVDPTKIDMGARTDGRGTGDQRHKATVDPDGDAYE